MKSKLPSGVMAAAVAIWIGYLLFRIVTQDVTIGTPATESEALTRANERLIQMVQWTIATVLTIGGALIGFNWFVSQRERDALGESASAVVELTESLPVQVTELEERLSARLVNVELATMMSLDLTSGLHVLREAEALFHPLKIPVQHFIGRFLSTEPGDMQKRTYALLIPYTIQRLKESGDLSDIDRLAILQALPIIFQFDQIVGFSVLKELGPPAPNTNAGDDSESADPG